MDLSLPKKRRTEDERDISECSQLYRICEDCSRTGLPGSETDKRFESICVTCEKYLCHGCITRHTAEFEYHLILKRNSVTNEGVANLLGMLENTHLWDDFMTVRAESSGLLQCKHSRDGSQPWLSGMTVLKDDKSTCKIAVVDFNNSSVKIINVQLNIIDQYYKLDTKPWDITSIDCDNMAVTCPEIKSIIKLSITDKMKISAVFNVNVDCHGICYVNETFYVSSTAPACVLIIDKHGIMLNRIDTTKTGEPLFQWPLYITVSQECNSILVSNYFQDKVLRLNLQDLSVSEPPYSHEQLQYPRGVVYNDFGSVFLAGRRNVHQLGVNCKHIQVLLHSKHGIEWSQCLAYSNKCCLLFIGKHSSNPMSGLISVFKIR